MSESLLSGDPDCPVCAELGIACAAHLDAHIGSLGVEPPQEDPDPGITQAVSVWVNAEVYEGIRTAATALILPRANTAGVPYRVGDVLVVMPTRQHAADALAIWVGRRIVHLQAEPLLSDPDLRLASLRPLRSPEKIVWNDDLRSLAKLAKRTRIAHSVGIAPVTPDGSLNRIPGRRADLGR